MLRAHSLLKVVFQDLFSRLGLSFHPPLGLLDPELPLLLLRHHLLVLSVLSLALSEAEVIFKSVDRGFELLFVLELELLLK